MAGVEMAELATVGRARDDMEDGKSEASKSAKSAQSMRSTMSAAAGSLRASLRVGSVRARGTSGFERLLAAAGEVG